MFRVILTAAAAWLAACSSISEVGDGPRFSDPANVAARVPAIAHRSSLADYRPAGEIDAGGWRDANDLVGRIGGWRAYAKEAEDARAAEKAAEKTPEKPASAAPTAPAAPHRHH